MKTLANARRLFSSYGHFPACFFLSLSCLFTSLLISHEKAVIIISFPTRLSSLAFVFRTTQTHGCGVWEWNHRCIEDTTDIKEWILPQLSGVGTITPSKPCGALVDSHRNEFPGYTWKSIFPNGVCSGQCMPSPGGAVRSLEGPGSAVALG